MIENFGWLLTPQEIEFEKLKFKGKLAALSFKYSKHLDGLIRTRILIFAMSLLVFYRVIVNYLLHDFFSFEFFTERMVFASIIAIAGILFNKFRIASIIAAVIPLLLITSVYFTHPGQFNIRIIGFMIGVTLVITAGIYNHLQSKRIQKELEKNLQEHQWISG